AQHATLGVRRKDPNPGDREIGRHTKGARLRTIGIEGKPVELTPTFRRVIGYLAALGHVGDMITLLVPDPTGRHPGILWITPNAHSVGTSRIPWVIVAALVFVVRVHHRD